MLFYGILFFFISSWSGAVTETEFKKRVVKQLYPSLSDWSREGSFKGVSNIEIHYRVYGSSDERSQPIVIVPGWTEFSLKYMELAYDLIQHSFSPVYVLDHRGQGASGRILEDPQKSYVEDFLFYVKDLETFINQEVIPQEPEKDLRLISHSMGGLISLLYLLKHPKTFKAGALSAPMLKIKASEISQGFALLLSSVSKRLFNHQNFLVSKRKRNQSFSKNQVSHSLDRYEFNKYLEDKHNFYIKGATLSWAKESIKNSKFMRKQAEKISTPILFLKAGQDEVVDSKAIQDFAEKTKHSSVMDFENSKHEIFMEKDEIRNQALEGALEFFKKH